MRILKILLLCLTVSACSNVPTAPQTDNWSKLNTTQIQVETPIDLPVFPKASLENDKAAYDLKGAKTLQQFKIASKANYQIALKLAEELNWSGRERGQLIKAGQLTEQRANYYAEQFQIAEEGRREEAKWRLYERWGWQSLIMFLSFGL